MKFNTTNHPAILWDWFCCVPDLPKYNWLGQLNEPNREPLSSGMNMKAKASLPLGMVSSSADQFLVFNADRRDANIARTKSLKLAKLMLMVDKALFLPFC